MWKFTKCNKCGRDFMWFICPNKCEENKDIKKEIPKIIKEVKEVKQDIIKKVVKQEIVELDTFEWLKLYTASYLNHKLNKDLNSIKQEKICIKVLNKYILHEDIINKFKIDNWLTASEWGN